MLGTGARGTGYYRDGAPAFEAVRRDGSAEEEDLGLQLLKTVGRLRRRQPCFPPLRALLLRRGQRAGHEHLDHGQQRRRLVI